MDLKLSEHEQEQCYIPTLAMQKAIIYTNDLFSWAKEKAEQKAIAVEKDTFSAVAVLMKEYRLSETEALDLLREKTIECEKDHFAAVADLEFAGQISDNLYRYLDMTRLCHSGGMLWSALTDRYNKSGPAQINGEATNKGQSLASTTVENPAKTGPPVATSTGIKTPAGHAATEGALPLGIKAAGENGSAMNGDREHQLNGTKKVEEEVHANGVTLKEHARDVRTPHIQIMKSKESS